MASEQIKNRKRGRPRENSVATDFVMADARTLYEDKLAEYQQSKKKGGRKRGPSPSWQAASDVVGIMSKELNNMDAKTFQNKMSATGWSFGRKRKATSK